MGQLNVANIDVVIVVKKQPFNCWCRGSLGTHLAHHNVRLGQMKTSISTDWDQGVCKFYHVNEALPAKSAASSCSSLVGALL